MAEVAEVATTWVDKKFTRGDVLRMEINILTALQWRCNPVLANDIYHSAMAVCDGKHHSSVACVTNFLVELASVEIDFVECRPSVIVLACFVATSQHTHQDTTPWRALLEPLLLEKVSSDLLATLVNQILKCWAKDYPDTFRSCARVEPPKPVALAAPTTPSPMSTVQKASAVPGTSASATRST